MNKKIPKINYKDILKINLDFHKRNEENNPFFLPPKLYFLYQFLQFFIHFGDFHQIYHHMKKLLNINLIFHPEFIAQMVFFLKVSTLKKEYSFLKTEYQKKLNMPF